MALASDDGSGYDHQFVTPPADLLTCSVCNNSSVDKPYRSQCCGCTLCKPRLEDGMKTATISCHSQELTLTDHQVDISSSGFCRDKEKECELRSESTKCFGFSSGCQFEEVTCSKDCEQCLQNEHIEECLKFPTVCPNKCEVGSIPCADNERHKKTCPLEGVAFPLQLQHLSSHVMDECKCDSQNCHFTGELQFIEGEHKERCPKFPTVHPNKCEVDSIPNEDNDEHRNACPLEEVACPNNCRINLQCQNLTNHVENECVLRKVDCHYCHTTGEHQHIESEHKEQCSKFPIACINKCEVGSVPRDDVEEHMKNCPLELIQCEYQMVGCEERIARKDQKKHNKEKVEKHLSCTKQALTVTQKHLKAIEDKTNINNNLLSKQLEQMHTNYTGQLNLICDMLDRVQVDLNASQTAAKTMQKQIDKQLTSYENKVSAVRENFKDFQSQAQETTADLIQRIITVQTEAKKAVDCVTQTLENSENTFKQELEITQQKLANTCQKLSAAQEDAERTKEESKKKIDVLTQKLTNTEDDLFITKQQLAKTCQNLANAEKEHAVLAANTDEALAKVETKFQTKITEIEFAAQKRIAELENELQQKINLVEQQLYWYRTISLTAAKLSSGDQVVPVIVKLSEYTKKKNRRVTWYSDSFYTHTKGYKMCLCVSAANLSNGRRCDLSVKLYVMKGPYDDQLTWPLKGYCEIKLLNQIRDSDHYVSHNGIYWDYGHKRVTIATWEISKYYMWFSERFIDDKDLCAMTTTCQYLQDDCLYFQVQYVVE